MPSITTKERAQRVIDMKKIQAVPELQGWLVESVGSKKLYLVRLNSPNGKVEQYCTCPATVTCYHILAGFNCLSISVINQ